MNKNEIFTSWNENPSRAVVALGQDSQGGPATGCVLWHVGHHIHQEIEVVGVDLSNLGLDDAPIGISIWEGIFLYNKSGYPGEEELDAVASGSFRAPTPEEWNLIQQNKAPWNEEDWWES